MDSGRRFIGLRSQHMVQRFGNKLWIARMGSDFLPS